jgi:ABC-2 type transport system permease protein
VLAYGTASLATMAIFTTVLFGADWGGPLPAAALCVAMVLAIVSLTALVIVLARSERQAEGLASMVVFGLALLGGNFVFVSNEPPLLRKLALLTPNGWALRGFVDLATGDRSLGTIAMPVAAILGFAAVIGLLAAGVSRRALRT